MLDNNKVSSTALLKLTDLTSLLCFLSSKFTQKIKYVFSLTDLAVLVPMEYVSIPECIKQ